MPAIDVSSFPATVLWIIGLILAAGVLGFALRSLAVGIERMALAVFRVRRAAKTQDLSILETSDDNGIVDAILALRRGNSGPDEPPPEAAMTP